MKTFLRCVVLSALLVLSNHLVAGESKKPDPKSDKEIASYALGLTFGTRARQDAADYDIDAMAAGFREAVSGAESKLNDAETGRLMALYQAFVEKRKSGDKTTVLEDKSAVSNILGRNLGHRMSSAGSGLDAELAGAGFLAGAKGGPAVINVLDHKADIDRYIATLQNELFAKNKEAAPKIEKEGEEFLAANKAKDGVITTATGLQYKILVEGKGDIPKSSDHILVNYEGRLVGGKVFDSTLRHGKSYESDMVHLLPAWIEALKLMPVGSKWELYVPASLGYGENGQPPDIPGGSALIFDLELLSIKK